MATIAQTASTVVQRNVTGNQRVFTCEYAATTAAGSDTVATPLTIVDSVNVSWAFSATTALTTVNYLKASVSTQRGAIVVWNSTHDNLSVRYTVCGR